jgi:guanylate kinase
MLSPKPLVLCGPSGAGKSTLLKRRMADCRESFGFSVSHTTRPAREGELDGKAYHFVTKQQMEEVGSVPTVTLLSVQAVGRGDFIEHATFAGNMYGTSTRAVQDVRERGGRQLKFLPEEIFQMLVASPVGQCSGCISN